MGKTLDSKLPKDLVSIGGSVYVNTDISGWECFREPIRYIRQTLEKIDRLILESFMYY